MSERQQEESLVRRIEAIDTSKISGQDGNTLDNYVAQARARGLDETNLIRNPDEMAEIERILEKYEQKR